MTETYGAGMQRIFPTPETASAWEADVAAAVKASLAAGQTWRRLSTNSKALTIGCPRCTHAMDVTVDTVIGLRADDSDTYEVVCDCSEGHVEDDPTKKVSGCGFGRGLLIKLDVPG